ncbi:MAG: YbaN family protein [Candidatus Bathyarchaeota archaeon]|nr:YbaN family protein [Candidatus Bathyarchaeota archaeon]
MNSITSVAMQKPTKKKASRIKRAVFTVLGTIFLGLGAIGIVLPLLPTTPFLLASAACYLNGSERMHRWLLNNKLFGSYIKNYREGKGMSARAKIFTLTLLWVTILYSAFFVVNSWAIQAVLVAVCLGVTTHLLRIPTYRKATITIIQKEERTKGVSKRS